MEREKMFFSNMFDSTAVTGKIFLYTGKDPVTYNVLALAGCQATPKASLSLLSTAGQGRENLMKGS